jgi:hypothetical protein
MIPGIVAGGARRSPPPPWYSAVPALAAVHAFDALAFTASGDQKFTDRAGGLRTLTPIETANFGTLAVNNGLQMVAASGLSYGLELSGARITPANESVLIFFSRYNSPVPGSGIIGWANPDRVGGGANVSYFTGEFNDTAPFTLGSIIAAPGSVARNVLGNYTPSGTPFFLALAFSGGNVRAYANGGWIGSAIAKSGVPTTADRVGWYDSTTFALKSNDHFIAASYHTGTATLADLQTLEDACRAELAR